MLTCLALVATLSASSLAEIPALASGIETEARALSAERQLTPALAGRIEAFTVDTARFSGLLRSAGVGQDMPCIFQDIAKEARNHAAAFAAANTQTQRETAFSGLRAVLDDVSLLAPVAAMAALDSATR